MKSLLSAIILLGVLLLQSELVGAIAITSTVASGRDTGTLLEFNPARNASLVFVNPLTANVSNNESTTSGPAFSNSRLSGKAGLIRDGFLDTNIDGFSRSSAWANFSSGIPGEASIRMKTEASGLVTAGTTILNSSGLPDLIATLETNYSAISRASVRDLLFVPIPASYDGRDVYAAFESKFGGTIVNGGNSNTNNGISFITTVTNRLIPNIGIEWQTDIVDTQASQAVNESDTQQILLRTADQTNSIAILEVFLSGDIILRANGGLLDFSNTGTLKASFPEGITYTSESGAWGVVPIPPAVWLFGSGLLGFVGMARRKKA